MYLPTLSIFKFQSYWQVPDIPVRLIVLKALETPAIETDVTVDFREMFRGEILTRSNRAGNAEGQCGQNNWSAPLKKIWAPIM
jgi:hypothetical protein